MQEACQIGAHGRAAHVVQRRDERTLCRRFDDRLERGEYALTVALSKRHEAHARRNEIGGNGMKKGVQGDRKAFLTGLLRDVFFDAKRPATNPVTQEVLDSALAMALQAGVPATLGCIDAFSRTDFRPELASVKVPTLVLHGTADLPVSFDQAKATAAGIAGSKLIAYPDASHGLVVTERDRVTKDLQAFPAS